MSALREPVTVVGNGISGWACAAALADAGAPVTMIGPGLPYDRPPLSKRALATGRVPYLADAASIAARGINHVDGLVADLQVGRRRLTVQARAGGPEMELEFGPLVWATGLSFRRPPLPGADHLHMNSTAEDLQHLLPRLCPPGRRIAVVGAGLIGSETAATLARDHQVVLLEYGARPLGRFPEPVSRAAQDALVQEGVQLLTECRLEGIEPGEDGAGVLVTAEHGRLAADVMVAATGVAGTLPAALAVTGESTMETDETLAVRGMDGVWACGDVARFPHPRHGMLAIPHWDHARASGAHVAASVLGSRAAYVREPYWFSDIGRLRVQQVGLASAVCEWSLVDGMHVGLDADRQPRCVVLLDLPSRLREARGLVAV